MVTLAHISATSRAGVLAELADQGCLPSAEGLIINPHSIATRFGTALPMMIHNHRSASRMGLEASHICLASPYLYAFQAGLDDVVEQFDCGLPAANYALNPSWLWYNVVAGDQRLADLARYLNTDLRIGRADGVFMTRSLFDEMLAVLHRFFTPAEIAALAPLYPIEEVIFPTILPALLGDGAKIGVTRARVWEGGDVLTQDSVRAAIASGLHASGKRIPQEIDNPVRREVLANLPGQLVLAACLNTTDA